MLRTSAFVLRVSRFALVFVISSAIPLVAAEKTDSGTDHEKAQLLQWSARADAEAGDFASAAANLRDASRLVGDRVTEQRASRIADELEGGSPFANPGPLMELIRQNTGTPESWDEDGTGEGGGTMSWYGQGVFVGAPAVMASMMLIHDESRLDEVTELAKQANRNRDVRMSSDLRLVSLPRLERELAARLADGEPLPEEMQHLAGLSRIEYLFVFPETGDVVIGGPAADWSWDESGRPVSVRNGRPVLHLDDLVVLNRTFGDNGSGFFMCSIDPKKEQVKAVSEFVKENRRSLTTKNAAQFAQRLEDTLGLQNVLVDGVPADTRVAKVIVEADYRMKQIGIGELKGAPGMKSYFDLLSRSEQRGSGQMDALRWWMAVGYEAIRTTADGSSYGFTGDSVKCLSEDQFVNADGTRLATGKSAGANAKFAALFTQHFQKLAEQDPAFADLQNVFDLAMVSTLLQTQGLSHVAGWNPETLAGAGHYQPASVDVPTELMTAAAHRVYRGRHVVVQVAGGVRGNTAEIARDAARFQTSEELKDTTRGASPIGHSAGSWWWDAPAR